MKSNKDNRLSTRMSFNQPKKFEDGDRVYIATSSSDKNAGRQYYGTEKLRFVDWVTNGSTAGLEYDTKKKRYYYPWGVIPDEVKSKLIPTQNTSQPRPQVRSVPDIEEPKVDRVYNSGIPEPSQINGQVNKIVDALNRAADELYELRGFIESIKNMQKQSLELQQETVGMKRRKTELENIKWAQRMKKLPRLSEAQDPDDDTSPVISEDDTPEP